MQATLDARGLKPFTKALACIARYGDEMLIHSRLDSLVLTSMNQAKSAFCSFTFNRASFLKYTVQLDNSQDGNAGPSRSTIRGKSNAGSEVLRCQLQTKALLAVLRHRNNERSVEKCEISVVEGSRATGDEARENEDSFESRLVVRLHCKHGIVKTHRLLLNTPTHDEAPTAPESEFESHLTVQPRAIKDIFEHFPNAKGPKSDPELLWRFDIDEVSIKSLEKGIDSRGKSQLASEMFVPADDFELYNMHFSPITIGFFLREFNATITLADSLSIPLEMRFTLPAEPLYITAETEECSMLFVIATNITRADDDDPAIKQLRAGTYQAGSAQATAKKRALEEGAMNGRMTNGMRRPSKVVRRIDSQSSSRQNSNTQQSQNGISPSSGPGHNTGLRQPPVPAPTSDTLRGNSGIDLDLDQNEPPLFLSSQLSVADMEVLQQSGLGLETMTADEFAAMLDDEGEEVNDVSMKPPSRTPGPNSERPSTTNSGVTTSEEWDELDDDDMVMGPTQSEGSADKAFRPLFED